MAKRQLKDKLIHKNNIHEELRFIDISQNAYITPTGKIYIDYGNDMFLPRKQFISHGYKYCGILLKGKHNTTTKRVHRLVAQAYIPNPNNYKIVGHKDNNKTNNCVTNLYWTTIQENTQKAYDDNLAKTDSSWDDSQSIPICQFDLNGNLINTFGSISECSRKTKMTKTGILYQCNHKIKIKPRKGYYYRYKSEFDDKGFVL